MRKTLLAGLAAAVLLAAPAMAQAPATAPSKAPMPPAMTTNPAPAASTRAAAPAARVLDVNSATKAELMELPGIGEARSEAIVKNRPYKGKDDIVAKAGVPRAVYDKLKDRLVARQK